MYWGLKLFRKDEFNPDSILAVIDIFEKHFGKSKIELSEKDSDKFITLRSKKTLKEKAISGIYRFLSCSDRQTENNYMDFDLTGRYESYLPFDFDFTLESNHLDQNYILNLFEEIVQILIGEYAYIVCAETFDNICEETAYNPINHWEVAINGESKLKDEYILFLQSLKKDIGKFALQYYPVNYFSQNMFKTIEKPTEINDTKQWEILELASYYKVKYLLNMDRCSFRQEQIKMNKQLSHWKDYFAHRIENDIFIC